MKKLAFAYLICFCSLLSVDPIQASSKIAGASSFYDPLLYSHLVLRGVVTEVSHDHIRQGDWAPTSAKYKDMQMTIMRVEFDITEVLKGAYENAHISIPVALATDLTSVFHAGDEQILCLHFKESFRGGSYTVWSSDDVYTRSGETWVHEYDKKAFRLDELTARIEEDKIERVVEKADVVAVGIVKSSEIVQLGEDASFQVTEHTLEIENLLKGRIDGETVQFITYIKSRTHPWLTYTPRGIETNQRWYVFLERRGRVYHPFAGPNGLFKVVGNKLIYDDRVPYELAKSDLDKVVLKVLANEE